MPSTKRLYWLTGSGLHQMEAWAHDGLTDQQIARRCGINRRTLFAWQRRYPQIAAALEQGRDARRLENVRVENALLRRALGYSYTVEEVRLKRAPDGTIISRVVVLTVKHVPPDLTAALMWLVNRCPARWRRWPTGGGDTSVALEKVEELLRGIG